MGYSGGIATFNNPDFKLNMQDFKTALRGQWQDAEIKELENGDIDFGMTLKEQFDGLLGSSIQQQQIGWWSGLEEFAEFIMWYRKYIPDHYKLLAWSTDFYNYVVVVPNIKEHEIVQGLSGYRYYCQIALNGESEEIQSVLKARLQADWHDNIIYYEQPKELIWFLKSQQGHLEIGKKIISFDDNEITFIAQFIIWCQSIKLNTIKLTVKHQVGFDAEFDLMPNTTQNELVSKLKDIKVNL